MLQIGKTLALLLLKRTTPNKPALFKNLITGLTMIAFSSFVTAILVSSLILGILICAHGLLVEADLSHNQATAIIVVLILAIIGALVCYIVKRIQTLQESFSNFVDSDVPAVSHVAHQANDIGKAFIDGLLNRPSKSK